MTTTTQDLIANAKSNIREVSVDTIVSKIHTLTVIDVREPDEFAAAHIPGAINIPRGVLEFKITDNPSIPSPEADLLVYCQGGGRGALATQTLMQLGYTNAQNLSGGFKAWQEADSA